MKITSRTNILKRMRKNGFLPFMNASFKKNSRKLAQIMALTLLFVNVVALRAAEPVIVIRQLPPIGQDGNVAGIVAWDGLNAGNASQYAVIAMLHAIWEGGGGYFVKPYYSDYLNVVDENGHFSIHITTGGIDTEVDEVILYFVERSSISEADIANPTTMSGKYLKIRTVYRSQWIPPQPPESNTPPGFVEAGTKITLSTKNGGNIRYTIDGSNPVTSSTAQTYNNQSLTVPNDGNLLIKAIAIISDDYSEISSLVWLSQEPLSTPFWGLNVSLALNGEYFGFPLSEETTRQRMEQVTPLTKWVRTFGTLNNGLEFVNKIAKEAGLRTMIGVYITNSATDNNAQIEGLRKILQMGPPPDLIAVGNETSLLGVSPATLIACVDAVREMVLSFNLKIPVGSVDLANTAWQKSVLEKLDFTGINIYHGVWDNTPENQMLNADKQTYQNTLSSFPSKLVLLTEIGAPYAGGQYSVSGGTQTASEQKAADLLCGYLDWVAQENIPSFYFEAFDEPVKSQNGGHPIEQYFGIMDGNLQIHSFYRDCLPCSNNTALIDPQIVLSPNPFTDQLILKGAEGCTLTVFTESGVTVLTQKMADSVEPIRLDHLPTGLYFFYFEKEGKAKTVKAVKL